MWLSPRQVMVIPISTKDNAEYAEEVKARLVEAGFFADIDLSGKVRVFF